jgi:hypothetical protein
MVLHAGCAENARERGKFGANDGAQPHTDLDERLRALRLMFQQIGEDAICGVEKALSGRVVNWGDSV